MRFILLFGLILTSACCPPPSAPPEPPAEADKVSKIASESEEDLPPALDWEQQYGWIYRGVPAAEADAILIVTFSMSGRGGETLYDFPLKRNSSTYTSRIDPDATSLIEGRASIMSCADGIDKDGRGIGRTVSISLDDGTPTHITVRLSISGTDEDQKRYSVKDEVRVPWLGRTEKPLKQGGRIAAHFETKTGKKKNGTDRDSVPEIGP